MRAWALLALAAAGAACGVTATDERAVHRVKVPVGASFAQVADTLGKYDIVRSPRLFRIYGRVTGVAGDIKAGTYEFREGSGWREVLGDLVAGRIASDRLVVPEGWEVRRIAPTLARILEHDPDSLFGYMMDTATARRFGVPGPNLEGYLYPETYKLPKGKVDPRLLVQRQLELFAAEPLASVTTATANGGTREYFRWEERQGWLDFVAAVAGRAGVPATSRAHASGVIETTHSATASRSVGSFAPTSTIRARSVPDASGRDGSAASAGSTISPPSSGRA